jgi:hypothetical protein
MRIAKAEVGLVEAPSRGLEMRYSILCGVILLFPTLGCGSRTTINAAGDHSKGENSKAVGSETTAAPNRDSNDTTAESVPNRETAVVELDAIRLTPPVAWTKTANSSSFVAAEFSLPRADGDSADGRLTISTAGGSLEANIDRWKGQFKPQPKSMSQEDVEIAGMKAKIVDMSGDFNDQRGPFGPGELRPDYRMIAAVIPVGDQLHFVKATGPQKTIASHATAIQQFIRSAKPTN